MNFINKSLPKINEQSSPIIFEDICDLEKHEKLKNINERQEFWFGFIDDDNLYCCIFEYFYEG